jgi:ribosomal protein L21
VIVGTFRRRKDSKKKKGHRQDFTRLRVTGIKH